MVPRGPVVTFFELCGDVGSIAHVDRNCATVCYPDNVAITTKYDGTFCPRFDRVRTSLTRGAYD